MSSDLLTLFKERGALLEGHFLLSSGLHSARYLQCARVLMDPPLATRLGAELAATLEPSLASTPAAVVSPAIGGIVIGQEVARGLGCLALFSERQDGRMALRRGFELAAGDGVVVVEDVITTGGSTREVMELVHGKGGRVLGVGCVVDRSGGVELGVPLRSLLTLEVPTHAAAACPLCAAGGTPEKPGSRTRPAQ